MKPKDVGMSTPGWAKDLGLRPLKRKRGDGRPTEKQRQALRAAISPISQARKAKPNRPPEWITDAYEQNQMMRETSLVPEAVAESILEEVQRGYDVKLSEKYVESLSNQARRIYFHNPSFAKSLRGAKGRELLYSFMRHWLSSDLRKDQPALYHRLSYDFRIGREP